jgi:hypothetical protein
MSRTYQPLSMMLHFIETFGSNYPFMQNRIVEAQNPQLHCCENLRTCNERNLEICAISTKAFCFHAGCNLTLLDLEQNASARWR